MTIPRTALVLLAFVAALLAALTATAAPATTSSAPALLAGPTVESAQFSPDGDWAVYTATSAQDPAGQLYSVSFTGGTPIQLNNSTDSFDDYVNGYWIAPDSASVIFTAGPAPEGLRQLYRVPIGGGTIQQLNDTLPSGYGVDFVQVASGGQGVVFSTRPESGIGVRELFVVPVTGGSPRRLSPPLTGEQQVLSWQLSEDGSRAVFSVELSAGAPVPLYSVALPDGQPVELGRPFTAADTVTIQLNRDGQWITFARADEPLRVYRVAASGGTIEPLAVPPEATLVFNWAISPDGAYVVYAANTNGGFNDLYSVPVAAAEPFVKLTEFMADGSEAGNYRISPNSERVVFAVGSGRSALYTAPIAGGTAVEIPSASTSGGGPGRYFQISPDSGRIVYYEQQTFRSAPLAGGPSVVIADDVSQSGGVAYSFNATFSANGRYFFFRNALASDSSQAPLFVAPVDRAGGARRLSGDVAYVAGQPNQFDRFGAGFDLSQSGERVIFRGADGAQVDRSLYGVEVEELQIRIALPLLQN